MRIFDGSKVVDIQIRRWEGSGYGPDCSFDYFDAGCLPYDAEADFYRVDDVDYCIDYAQDDFADDDDMFVLVDSPILEYKL